MAKQVTYTQIKIKVEYREKLAKLASSQNRSMANMIEVLIDQTIAQNQEAYKRGYIDGSLAKEQS